MQISCAHLASTWGPSHGAVNAASEHLCARSGNASTVVVGVARMTASCGARVDHPPARTTMGGSR